MRKKTIINATDKPFDWDNILKWCDKLDVDIVFCEHGADYFVVQGTELEVNLLDSAITEGTDKYIEEYLWGRIKEYICPFYDKCEGKCSSRYNVHFKEDGCPWGYERPMDGSFKPTEFDGITDFEFEEILQ